jgi:hypothetical protein
MGIQFHLEATIESIKLFIENGRNELVPNKEFIQSEKQILQTTKYIKKSNEMMIDILEKLTK